MKIDHTETAPAGHLRYVLRTSWQEIQLIHGLVEKACQYMPKTEQTAAALNRLNAIKRGLSECLRDEAVIEDMKKPRPIKQLSQKDIFGSDPRETFTLPTFEAPHALMKAVDKLLPKPKDNRSIPFTPRAKKVPKYALKIARELGHDCVQPIHILIAALRSPAHLRLLLQDAGYNAMDLADAFTEKAKHIDKYSPAKALVNKK